MSAAAAACATELSGTSPDVTAGAGEAPPEGRTRTRSRENAIVMGAAMRAAQDTAAMAQPPLTRKAWKMLKTVEALVTSYSRLTDRYSLEQVADRARIGGNAETRRKEASRALRQLRDAGVIVYQPGRGHRLSLIGLPAPPPVESEPTGAAAPPSNGGGAVVEAVPDSPSNGGGTAPLQRGQQRPPTRVVLREEDLPLRQVVPEPEACDPPEGKADEDRKHRQEPTDAGAALLASVLAALPEPVRAELLTPNQTGARRTLEQLLPQLRAKGWTDDVRLVAELTEGLATADAPIGALIHRVRAQLASGPPPGADELAAADAARRRRDELRAAANHGRHVAAATDAQRSDEGRRLLTGHYRSDPEALRAALGAFEAVLGEHGVAPPLRPVENDDPRDELTWRGGLRSARAALAGAGSDRGRP